MIDTLIGNGFGAALVVVLALVVYSRLRAVTLAGAYPPVGKVVSVDGVDLHYVDVPADSPSAPTLVFVHGASGNLRDPMTALRRRLAGRYRMLFVDRPGHGWSGRSGRADAAPARQADRLAGLLDALAVDEAVLVGHSWGGSAAAAFALGHPQRTAGLVFLAPATHPWPGGVTWYYHVAALPVLGHLFVNLLTVPVGLLMRDRALRSVFFPAAVPDGYAETAAVDLVLRPATFRANAEDVADLHGYVTAMAPRYPAIAAPTTIVADRADKVVYTRIHSTGLERDIDGARLVLVDGAGHMPHHTRPEVVIAAIDDVVDRRRRPVPEAARTVAE